MSPELVLEVIFVWLPKIGPWFGLVGLMSVSALFSMATYLLFKDIRRESFEVTSDYIFAWLVWLFTLALTLAVLFACVCLALFLWARTF